MLVVSLRHVGALTVPLRASRLRREARARFGRALRVTRCGPHTRVDSTPREAGCSAPPKGACRAPGGRPSSPAARLRSATPARSRCSTRRRRRAALLGIDGLGSGEELFAAGAWSGRLAETRCRRSRSWRRCPAIPQPTLPPRRRHRRSHHRVRRADLRTQSAASRSSSSAAGVSRTVRLTA